MPKRALWLLAVFGLGSQVWAITNLGVDWLPAAEPVAIATLGDFNGPPEYECNLAKEAQVFRVGVIKSLPFAGKNLYIFGVPDPYCSTGHYRVIDDRGGKGLVLLANLSNQVREQYREFFKVSEDYEIPALHLPDLLEIAHQGQTLRLRAEPFSPAIMYSQALADGVAGGGITLSHPQYGQLEEARHDSGELRYFQGYFTAEVPDHTIKLYRLEFPGEASGAAKPSGEWYSDLVLELDLEINLSEGGVLAGTFTPSSPRMCPPRDYQINRHPGQPVLAGKSPAGQAFYFPITTQSGEGNKPGMIYWRDPLGRWFELIPLGRFPSPEMQCAYVDSVL